MVVWNSELMKPEYLPVTAWTRHGPFAMWLVHNLKPRKIVELGTHTGYSYFCFCQAVAEANVKTECFAIDTWEGDEHAGFYDNSVFESVRNHNAHYKKFSTLLKKTFEEGLQDIQDGSVDLLHVDGRHGYDDVKTDFESWIPKLSSRAVVLFHDTEVRDRDFGVWRYWSEISNDHPSLNFPYQHGLGVLFWGPDVADGLKEIVSDIEDSDGKNRLIDYFWLLGEKHQLQQDLNGVVKEAASCKHNLESKKSELVQSLEGMGDFVSRMQNELIEARRRPLKQLKRKLMHKILRTLSKASPPFSTRTAARFAKSAAKRNPRRRVSELVSGKKVGGNDYQSVIGAWEAQRSSISKQIVELTNQLADGVLISVIVIVRNPQPSLLKKMIESVLSQSYSNWELCIATDTNANSDVGSLLEDFSNQDSRIRCAFINENFDTTLSKNSLIETANGSFVTFVDSEDQLDRDALLLVAKAVNDHPNTKIIYTDEDKLQPDGKRSDPHFKPDWNRELLYGTDYISNFAIYDAEILRQTELFRSDFKEAHNYDLLLRCTEHVSDEAIFHISKILYSKRYGSIQAIEAEKNELDASESGRLALVNHLTRFWGKHISVEDGPTLLTYRPIWPVENELLVSIIIPTRDHLDVLRVAVDSILGKTNYQNFELIIVDNGSVEPETLAWLDSIKNSDARVRIIRDERPFNYSALNNNAVAQSHGNLVALVNNDIEVVNPDWLTEMVSLAQRQDVGCVGAKLYYPDGRIQHAGIIIGTDGSAGHGHLHYPGSHSGYFSRLLVRQQYSAVTAACLLVRRAVYDEVGGLNQTELTIAYNDVDFCLKVEKAGYKNLWSPFAELIHHESLSRGFDDTPEKRLRTSKEIEYVQRTWNTDTYKDPAFNQNLSLDGLKFEMASPHWGLEN